MNERLAFTIDMRPPVPFDDRPPVVTIVGYPPLPGETSREYRRRVHPLVMAEAFKPEPTLWRRAKRLVSGA